MAQSPWCDTQSVLSKATPEEIREHVKERLALFKPGGGYVFNLTVYWS
jgi:hypothetical protein